VSGIEPQTNGVRWPDQGWATAAVGCRVSVRRATGETGPTGGPAFRDVVGLLVSVDGESGNNWTIRRRSGDTVVVDAREVVAAKIVPDVPSRPRTASDIEVRSLEELAARAWQPLERESLGEWSLRAAVGFTGRANSVLPLGTPGRPLDTALADISRWYEARSLPPKIQVPLPLCDRLDSALADRGWLSDGSVSVMVTDLERLQMGTSARVDGDPYPRVDIASTPDKAWLGAFRYGDVPAPPASLPMMTMASHPVFASGRDSDNATLAIGRGAIEGRWLGLTAIEVAQGHRRQGLGRQIVRALAAYAASHGCRHVWLQVARDNGPARALYTHLGFVDHHHYVYRQLDLRHR
jgi:N-acetylglutamate synthase